MAQNDKEPRVSVIIPSWDGHRDGCVPRLLASVDRQTFKDYEVLLVKGVSPQGRAINQGAARARGEILLVLDDDSYLAEDTVFERLVEVLDGNPMIGMAGASIVVPPDASRFQQRAALQFPRFNTPVVDRVTDSDLACHGCCAFPMRVSERSETSARTSCGGLTRTFAYGCEPRDTEWCWRPMHGSTIPSRMDGGSC